MGGIIPHKMASGIYPRSVLTSCPFCHVKSYHLPFLEEAATNMLAAEVPDPSPDRNLLVLWFWLPSPDKIPLPYKSVNLMYFTVASQTI